MAFAVQGESVFRAAETEELVSCKHLVIRTEVLKAKVCAGPVSPKRRGRNWA